MDETSANIVPVAIEIIGVKAEVGLARLDPGGCTIWFG